MLFIDFPAAWAVYRSADRLLPQFPAPTKTKRVSGVVEASQDFDVVLFDAYGVLHTGSEGFPQSQKAVRALRALGKKLAIVTNDVTRGPGRVAEQLRLKGFEIAEDEVISARSVLDEALLPYRGQKIGLLASPEGDAIAAYPDFPLISLGDDAMWESCAAVLFVDNNAWMEWSAAEWFRSVTRRMPKPLVVCNPDVGCPYRGGMTAEPGFFSFEAALATGAPLRCLGKPYPEVYQAAIARFPDVPAERFLMVGDSPHTDVLGARSMGMACLLVECGFLAGEDAMARCREAGLLPDFIAAFP